MCVLCVYHVYSMCVVCEYNVCLCVLCLYYVYLCVLSVFTLCVSCENMRDNMGGVRI